MTVNIYSQSLYWFAMENSDSQKHIIKYDMKYHGWVTTQEASQPGTEPATQHLERRICTLTMRNRIKS